MFPDRHLGANVKIIETPVDDIWMRDIAPLYIVRGSEVIPLDLNFNGWGAPKLRPQRPGDRLAGTARNLFGGEMINAGFVAEGGAFVVGRDGVVFTTRSCLLHRNRNPQLNETDIECELLRFGLMATRASRSQTDMWMGTSFQRNLASLLFKPVKTMIPAGSAGCRSGPPGLAK